MGEFMKVYFMFSKTYGIVLCVLFLLCFSVLSIATQSKEKTTLDSEGKRSNYLLQMGYDDAENISSREVVIPSVFENEYKIYNNIMMNGGFDLSSYKGRTAMLYTYSYNESAIHLLCFDGQLICADICNLSDKSIYPLKERKNG